MRKEISGQFYTVLFDVMSEAFRPAPDTISKFRTAHFVLSDAALEAAPRIPEVSIADRRRAEVRDYVVAPVEFPVRIDKPLRVGQTEIVETVGATPKPYSLQHDLIQSPNGRYLRCLLYTSPSPRDKRQSRMPSSA